MCDMRVYTYNSSVLFSLAYIVGLVTARRTFAMFLHLCYNCCTTLSVAATVPMAAGTILCTQRDPVLSGNGRSNDDPPVTLMICPAL
jgi:hypothetical protein